MSEDVPTPSLEDIAVHMLLRRRPLHKRGHLEGGCYQLADVLQERYPLAHRVRG